MVVVVVVVAAAVLVLVVVDKTCGEIRKLINFFEFLLSLLLVVTATEAEELVYQQELGDLDRSLDIKLVTYT